MYKATKLATTFLAGAVLLCSAGFVTAEDSAKARPTFYKDVLPIIQENCQICHRPSGNNIMGMVAPMAFMTYEEVRPWSKAIVKQVQTKRMPPWHASEDFHGVFKNERTLSEAEIDTIVRWAETGAARGKPTDAPKLRTFPQSDGYAMGEPDLIVAFPEALHIQDSWGDMYQTVVVPITKEMMPEDQWIQAMEFKPGSEAVHHIVIFTSSGRESLGFGQGMLGGMGPGTDGTTFPEGYGRLLETDSTIMFNMHYHKESGPGTAVWDKSEIAFKFHDKPVKHNVSWGAVGTMALSIPPNTTHHLVKASETFTKDTLFLAIFPHTHLRGTASKYTAYYPDGTSEVLIDVPNYDFNWQTNYVFKEPKFIPAGTRVEVSMWYDNDEARAELAGIDPTRTVRWGQATTDEMMFGWIDYTDAEPMDPNATAAESQQAAFGGGVTAADVIQMMDTNSDGKISLEEAPEGLKGSFGMIDTNGDGEIDIDEAEMIARFMGNN